MNSTADLLYWLSVATGIAALLYHVAALAPYRLHIERLDHE